MFKSRLIRSLAAVSGSAVLALGVAGPAAAKHGADDPAGHVRHGRGADDPAGHR